MTYNRSAIMAHANRLHRQGMPRSEAMKAAWSAAKASQLPTYSRQQEAGLRAALKRYGLDPDKIALRAQEAVKAIVAAVASRPALLPPPAAGAINLTKGEDGVYRL